MTTVLIKTDSHYSVDRNLVRKTIDKVLTAKGVKTHVEVSISIVGDRQMRSLNKMYRATDVTTDVLSFSLTEDSGSQQFITVPDGILRLGDIVVSYPQAVEEAVDENKLVDEKVCELVEHGLLHLLGQHHE